MKSQRSFDAKPSRLALRKSQWLIALVALASIEAGATCATDLDNLEPGEWYEVPNSALESSPVVASPAPPGYTGVRAVMVAWSGAAFDSRRDRLLVWGGGHSDYAGNEIYAFDVNTCTWDRIWGPTPNSQIHDGSSCTETYADGNPASRHTYDGLQYLPQSDRFWAQGGSLWCGAGAPGSATWVFDMTALRWTRHDNAPQEHLGITSAYDPVSGNVYSRGYSVFSEYNPANGSWRVVSNQPGYGADGDSNSAAVDTRKNMYVEVGNGTRAPASYVGVRVWNLSNFSYSEPVTSGATSVVNGKPGVVFDSVLNKVVAYAGGTSVYSLDTDTWVWTEHRAASTNSVTPPQPVSQGMFGRFQYMPSKNAYIFANDASQSVYFYKLSGGSGTPPPPVTTPEAPQNLTAD